MYEYFLSVVLIIITLVILINRKAHQRTMENVVGRLATKFIENMLEQVRQKIINEGFDNWLFDVFKKEFEIAELFKCHISIQNVLFSGASKFVTNDISYDVTTSKANFDISIPKLYLGVGDSNAGATIGAFGMDIAAQVKGWIALMEPRVSGAVVLTINEEGKVIASSIDVNIELKEIQSKITLNVMETDYSVEANNFLQAKLPVFINTYVNSCKAAIEMGLMSIANSALAQML